MSHEPPVREGQILTGLLFNEPMQVETVRPIGDTGSLALLADSRSVSVFSTQPD